MTTQLSIPCLPAFTDAGSDVRFGSSFTGLPVSAGLREIVLDNAQLEGFPQPVSINLSRDFSRVPPGGGGSEWDGGYANGDAHARITFRAGVSVSEMFCDWGCQFSLVCSALRIELESFQPDHRLPYDVSGIVSTPPKFTALVGLGAVAPTMGPTYTSGLRPVSGGLAVPFVPPFGGRYFPRIYRQYENGSHATLYPVEPGELRNLRVMWGNHTTVGEVVEVSDSMLLSGIDVPHGAVGMNVSFEATGFLYVMIDHFRLRL